MTDSEILNQHADDIGDAAYKIMVKGKRKHLLDLIRQVREDERDRCAKLADEERERWYDRNADGFLQSGRIATAIRLVRERTTNETANTMGHRVSRGNIDCDRSNS